MRGLATTAFFPGGCQRREACERSREFALGDRGSPGLITIHL